VFTNKSRSWRNQRAAIGIDNGNDSGILAKSAEGEEEGEQEGELRTFWTSRCVHAD